MGAVVVGGCCVETPTAAAPLGLCSVAQALAWHMVSRHQLTPTAAPRARLATWAYYKWWECYKRWKFGGEGGGVQHEGHMLSVDTAHGWYPSFLWPHF